MIKITNLRNNDCVNTPLVLLKGSIHHIESSFLSVYYNDECIEWPVVDGCFVAFVQLVSENNTILLTVNNDFKKCKLKFNLLFHRTNATKLIKLVYVLCKDSKGDIFDGGKYQAPLIYDSSILSAIEKISFLALVIQCFFASTSLNRQSLNFETKSEIQPFVHILLVEKTNEELWLLDQQQLWRYIASELIKSELFSPHCKFLTLCSFTRCEIEIDNGHNLKYEKLLKLSRGSVALGGGGLALIGTPFLFTLPNGVRDMFLKLCQNEKFDSETERGVLDLCAATIGTCIHELGHTLDLGHSKVQKLKCKWWNRSSFLILSHHKWFRENCEEQETVITRSNNHLRSKYGIVVIEYRNNDGFIVKYTEFQLPLKIVKLDKCSNFCNIFAMDTKGNSIKLD
ncbi:putative zinc metalloproteinase-like protein [Dinothrombium tinctorium]|uniref:Putative zinc metalloproteinase-like protein n=1 Tax=Dinothrombium tinctorium TaxID=1965070 RepID=A0A3S3SMD2_9ACAR|nr:putative zinc metalloproteinase-like protein [Dinothrombium tinctorium]RWS16094.1 putative zinc metalloproteinase-like protein [Dinothrombium tinctorium]